MPTRVGERWRVRVRIGGRYKGHYWQRKVDAIREEKELHQEREFTRAGLEKPLDDILIVDYAKTFMKKRRLKQVEAAHLFGVRQPDISKMLRGDFRQFSVERLLRFLVALGQNVEIVVKPHHDRKNAPALHVS